MKSHSLLYLFFMLIIACSMPMTSQAARESKAPIRVLFIGNSYTYVNNIPGQVQALAKAKGISMDIARVAPGGYSLGAHWQDGEKPKKTRTVIAQKKYRPY